MTESKPIVKLEKWSNAHFGLIGTVYGHPNFEDGTEIQTTRVIRFDDGANIAETKNTIYQLGVRFE